MMLSIREMCQNGIKYHAPPLDNPDAYSLFYTYYVIYIDVWLVF